MTLGSCQRYLTSNQIRSPLRTGHENNRGGREYPAAVLVRVQQVVRLAHEQCLTTQDY